MHRASTWGLLSLAVLSCATGGERTTPSEAGPRSAELTAPATRDASSPAMSRRDVIRKLVPQNVRLLVYQAGKAKRTASGVVVSSERTADGSATYIVTNAHAIDFSGLEDARLMVLVDRGAETTEYAAEVVATGKVPEMDLALVRMPGVELPAAALATDDELELGSDVVVVAAPYGRALSLSGGMVSQVEWDPSTRAPRMLKTDAAIGYGASGGGIYSLHSGKLLAIVEGYRTAKVGFAVDERDFSFDVPMPGETFAAPSAKVRQFLEAKGYARLLREGRGGTGAHAAAQP